MTNELLGASQQGNFSWKKAFLLSVAVSAVNLACLSLSWQSWSWFLHPRVTHQTNHWDPLVFRILLMFLITRALLRSVSVLGPMWDALPIYFINSHSGSVRRRWLLPFHTWGNWGTEGWSTLDCRVSKWPSYKSIAFVQQVLRNRIWLHQYKLCKFHSDQENSSMIALVAESVAPLERNDI